MCPEDQSRDDCVPNLPVLARLVSDILLGHVVFSQGQALETVAKNTQLVMIPHVSH